MVAKLKEAFLELPLVYKTWQGLFAKEKIRPFLGYIADRDFKTVLDLGCGPGTNSSIFEEYDYTGVDINPDYIDYCRKNFKGTFEVADASKFLNEGKTYDIILVNSLLHHLDSEQVESLLRNSVKMMSETSEVHIVDAVLEPKNLLSYFLAKLDRGAYFRETQDWEKILSAQLTTKSLEHYYLKLLGLKCYRMFHMVGGARDGKAEA